LYSISTESTSTERSTVTRLENQLVCGLKLIRFGGNSVSKQITLVPMHLIWISEV